MSPPTCGSLTKWTIGAVLLQVLGVYLFVLGFFPVKPTLPGVSGPESYRIPSCDSPVVDGDPTPLPPDQLRSLYQEMSELPPFFDRLILMVIDGLPAEFVLGKGDQSPNKALMDAMPYTQSLLLDGRAVGYHARAAPPTVTMPRLKAMVSGAVGGFLDVAFNFNTQAFLDDNLLDLLYKVGWRMVMLGDETWVKLFPGLFIREDRVSSFYVKDTVEVDHNVSRHLDYELINDDWNLLILHYLGLDHVGHIGGRYSALMPPKLKEMDEVIEKIHKSMILDENNLDKRTLLMIVSDHGMTASGNHGGSSYEETDSLVMFVGVPSKVVDYALPSNTDIFQVDIAPTLALLFGVPIPKNNVGVLIPRILGCFTEKQRLRALELNSWQVLRLLQAQLPGLLCGNSPCTVFSNEKALAVGTCNDSLIDELCCLYSKAMSLHSFWKSQSNNTDTIQSASAAYYEFLRRSTQWLSRRVTDKPFNLLASGVSALLISCLILLSLLFQLCREVCLMETKCFAVLNDYYKKWRLDESFVCIAVGIHVLSLGASSMVEEEQYIWYFLTSTLFLIFLRMTLQNLPAEPLSGSCETDKEEENVPICKSYRNEKRYESHFELCSLILVLICGRILRGWHQGGVNWTHLPDISNWVKDFGILSVKSLQIVSVFLVISFGFFALFLVKSMKNAIRVIQMGLCFTVVLILYHIVESENHAVISTNSIVQAIYMMVGVIVIGTALLSPWIVPLPYLNTDRNMEPSPDLLPVDMNIESLLVGIRDSTCLIGQTCTLCWCQLQLLLQQPINALPIFMLLLQILATFSYFSISKSHHKQWVEVATMYFLGMGGHFSLGNSNTLATIDLAGAFMGISSHSTVLAGILVFMLTYASPLLFLLAMTMYIPMMGMKCLSASRSQNLGFYLKMMIGVPCILPLSLNSIVLAAFTFILLLMRNHLFVWSVFSPKYLYVCAATVSIYIGVSIVTSVRIYVHSVIFCRAQMFNSRQGSLVATKME